MEEGPGALGGVTAGGQHLVKASCPGRLNKRTERAEVHQTCGSGVGDELGSVDDAELLRSSEQKEEISDGSRDKSRGVLHPLTQKL